MEMGRSWRQSLLFGGEGPTCGFHENVSSSLAFRNRSFKFSQLGSGSYLRGIGVKKNLRITIACGVCDSSVRRLKEESWNRFHNSHGKRLLMFKVDDVFRLSRTSKVHCQSNDFLEYIDENGRTEIGDGVENLGLGSMNLPDLGDARGGGRGEGDDSEGPSLEELRDMLQKALKELEVASINRVVFEEKEQKILETAISLKDEAQQAMDDVDNALITVQKVVNEESVAKEAFQKATMALSLAGARLQVALESLEVAKGENDSLTSEETDKEKMTREKDSSLLMAEEGLRDCQSNLAECEAEWTRLFDKKEELQKEVDRLKEVAEKAQNNAIQAEEDVASIMALAEQAVALELEALQRVNDVEIFLQKAEKSIGSTLEKSMAYEKVYEDDSILQEDGGDASYDREIEIAMGGDHMAGGQLFLDQQPDSVIRFSEEQIHPGNSDDQAMGKLAVDAYRETEVEAGKWGETEHDTQDSELSFWHTKAIAEEIFWILFCFILLLYWRWIRVTPASAYQGLLQPVKEHWPKLILGALLFGAGLTFITKQVDRSDLLLQQPEAVTVSIEEVSSHPKSLVRQLKKLPERIKKLMSMIPQQEVNEEEASLLDMLWSLLAIVHSYPCFRRSPEVHGPRLVLNLGWSSCYSTSAWSFLLKD